MRQILFIFLLIFTFALSAKAQPMTPIKILLVPGHDDESWGAQYGTLKEADMNLRLTEEIQKLLEKDPQKFQVYITRDWDGYKKEFADYFSTNREAIILFRDNLRKEREKKILSGHFVEKENVPHNTASEEASVILYGINKWANENKIDAVIHIHFNDYPRDTKWAKGKYKGFAVYIPDLQMANSYESTKLGLKIFGELKKKYAISDYEPEKLGIIPDQNLIALGGSGSLRASVKSVLIEYGYIYRFGNKSMRFRAYREMASPTAKGLKNYFLPTP